MAAPDDEISGCRRIKLSCSLNGSGFIKSISMAHQHGHGHHHHDHAPDLHEANSRSFLAGIVLNLLFVIAEIIAGLWNGSMSLLTDAGHNIGDVAGLVLSLFAFRLARRKPTETYTYGYKKTTILAALANAVVLLIGIGVLGYESVVRLRHPQPVQGGIIAWVAAAGIAVNALSAWIFYKNRTQDLNVKSAYLHLLTDAMVSAGVVAGGVLIAFTGWYWVDPAIGLVVMVVILGSTWSLLRDSFRMAVDAVPSHISLPDVIEVMRRVKNVTGITHVHVWSLSTTEQALTAHVIVNEELSFEEKMEVVQAVRHELLHHNIQHSTLELETNALAVSCSIPYHAAHD